MGILYSCCPLSPESAQPLDRVPIPSPLGCVCVFVTDRFLIQPGIWMASEIRLSPIVQNLSLWKVHSEWIQIPLQNECLSECPAIQPKTTCYLLMREEGLSGQGLGVSLKSRLCFWLPYRWWSTADSWRHVSLVPPSTVRLMEPVKGCDYVTCCGHRSDAVRARRLGDKKRLLIDSIQPINLLTIQVAKTIASPTASLRSWALPLVSNEIAMSPCAPSRDCSHLSTHLLVKSTNKLGKRRWLASRWQVNVILDSTVALSRLLDDGWDDESLGLYYCCRPVS